MSERVSVWLLVRQDGAALLARNKREGRAFAGRWTLPGDIMDESESAAETIERVCRDHLGVSHAGEEFVDTLTFEGIDPEHAINVFAVELRGRPRFRESGPYAEVSQVRAADLAQPIPALPEELRQFLLLELSQDAAPANSFQS